MKEFKGSKLLSFSPELKKIMSGSRDPEELQYYWEQWREQTGQKYLDQYKQYIDLYKEAAKLNGFRYMTIKIWKKYLFGDRGVNRKHKMQKKHNASENVYCVKICFTLIIRKQTLFFRLYFSRQKVLALSNILQ